MATEEAKPKPDLTGYVLPEQLEVALLIGANDNRGPGIRSFTHDIRNPFSATNKFWDQLNPMLDSMGGVSPDGKIKNNLIQNNWPKK